MGSTDPRHALRATRIAGWNHIGAAFPARARIASACDVILFCAGVGLAAEAAAVSMPLEADASIASGFFSQANFGSDTHLAVSGGWSAGSFDINDALLKFDLSPLPNGTAGADVEKATLLIWVSAAAASSGNPNHNLINVSAVNSEWSETAVTFNDRPAIGAPFATIPVTGTLDNRYIAIDVTQQVRTWLDVPGSNYGIEVFPDVGQDPRRVSFQVRMDSRENPAHPPIVDITLVGGDSVGPAAPPGVLATIQVGAITGAPGCAVAASNVGTSSPAVFSFMRQLARQVRRVLPALQVLAE